MNMKLVANNKVSKYAAILALTLGAGTAYAIGKANVALTDFDGDGVISADEIREARQAARADMISQFDTDGNGELSKEERRAAKQQFRASVVESFDANGDGELSRSERKLAKQAHKDAIMLQLDVNGDGEVSDAEKAGWEEVRSERGDKHRHGKRGKRHSDTDEETSSSSESN